MPKHELSQQKEFRAIKNLVIQEAEHLRRNVFTFEDVDMVEKYTDFWTVAELGLHLFYQLTHSLPCCGNEVLVGNILFLVEHGLFSNRPVSLDASLKEVEEHSGNVWTVLVGNILFLVERIELILENIVRKFGADSVDPFLSQMPSLWISGPDHGYLRQRLHPNLRCTGCQRPRGRRAGGPYEVHDLAVDLLDLSDTPAPYLLHGIQVDVRN